MDPLLLAYFAVPATITMVAFVGLKLHERSAPPIAEQSAAPMAVPSMQYEMPRFYDEEAMRPVNAQNITGSSLVTGDHNTVTTTARVTLPPAHTVDAGAELAALRKALALLSVPDRDRLNRAFKDAEEEVAKPRPNKEYVGDAVQRVLKVAKGANDFATQVETLTPRVAALASWIGPAGRALLSLVGLST
jgi:hypothetical protein